MYLWTVNFAEYHRVSKRFNRNDKHSMYSTIINYAPNERLRRLSFAAFECALMKTGL